MRLVPVLVFALALACEPSTPQAIPIETPAPSTQPTASPSPAGRPAWPDFDDPLPDSPSDIAALVVRVQRGLPAAIDAWLEEGGAVTEAADVRRAALAQQRLFRL